MRRKMHFPMKIRRRKSIMFKAAATRRRRNAVFELDGERERHLETLFMAVCSCDTDEVGQILRSRAFSSYCDASSDLLNCACATGNAESVQLLLENGFPFQSVGGKGDAPLHTAVRRGWLNIVKILLNFGADVNVETKSERRTPLHLTSVSRKLEVLQYLLHNEADVHKVDIYGSTALHLAADVGFSNGVSALLEFHSDPEVFNRDGWTALHLAAANGHLAVTGQLIEANATVDCQTRFGRTPLHWACARGHLQVVRLLLKHNASVEVKDKNEKTAFDHASSKEIRNLIEAVSSAANLSFIPRINTGISYIVGDSTLRQRRASAFAEAFERVRGSSNISYDSGISINGAATDDFAFEDRRLSVGDETIQRNRERRQRKKPIFSLPEGWRPSASPVGATAEGKIFRLLQKNESDGKQRSRSSMHPPIPGTGRSTSFGESTVPSELSTFWPQGESSQRSYSEPFYLEQARELGMYLSPILEDNKTSVGTSKRDECPTNSDEDRARSSREVSRLNDWRLRPRAEFRVYSSGDDSSKDSREDSSGESEDDSKIGSREPGCRNKHKKQSSHDLTRDLEKILERVSLASDKEATFAEVASGLRSSQSSLDSLNSGLKQLLFHLEAVRNKDNIGRFCSEA